MAVEGYRARFRRYRSFLAGLQAEPVTNSGKDQGNAIPIAQKTMARSRLRKETLWTFSMMADRSTEERLSNQPPAWYMVAPPWNIPLPGYKVPRKLNLFIALYQI